MLPTVLALVPLDGYGREDYAVPCGTACQWAMPYALDCPEYANMSAEERASAYPSPSCFANDTPYLTSLAWCIKSYCPEETRLYKIEEYWETSMIYEAESLRYTYPEALAKVDAKNPPKVMSPEETVLNRTIALDDAVWQASMNGVRGYKITSKNESKYS
jgi:hypothetical protein